MKYSFFLFPIFFIFYSCATGYQPEFQRTKEEIYASVIDTIHKSDFLPSNALLTVKLDPYVEYFLIWYYLEKHPTKDHIVYLNENYHGESTIHRSQYFQKELKRFDQLDVTEIDYQGGYSMKTIINDSTYWFYYASEQDIYTPCDSLYHLESYGPNTFKKTNSDTSISDWEHELPLCVSIEQLGDNLLKLRLGNHSKKYQEHIYRLTGNHSTSPIDTSNLLYYWQPNGRIYLSEKGSYLEAVKK